MTRSAQDVGTALQAVMLRLLLCLYVCASFISNAIVVFVCLEDYGHVPYFPDYKSHPHFQV